MTDIIAPGQEPTPDAAAALHWPWSVAAIRAALQHAGKPPKLDIRAMLDAALTVDGPAVTAWMLEMVMADRVMELDAAPFIIEVGDVSEMVINGQFLLAIFTGNLAIIQPKKITVTTDDADPSQLPLIEAPHARG